MVTFDLENSRNRTNDYKRAEDALRFRFGPRNYWKLVKQCHIVRTSLAAADVRSTLTQRLGSNCNILVVQLRKNYAYRLLRPQNQQQARDCLGTIEP